MKRNIFIKYVLFCFSIVITIIVANSFCKKDDDFELEETTTSTSTSNDVTWTFHLPTTRRSTTSTTTTTTCNAIECPTSGWNIYNPGIPASQAGEGFSYYNTPVAMVNINGDFHFVVAGDYITSGTNQLYYGVHSGTSLIIEKLNDITGGMPSGHHGNWVAIASDGTNPIIKAYDEEASVLYLYSKSGTSWTAQQISPTSKDYGFSDRNRTFLNLSGSNFIICKDYNNASSPVFYNGSNWISISNAGDYSLSMDGLSISNFMLSTELKIHSNSIIKFFAFSGSLSSAMTFEDNYVVSANQYYPSYANVPIVYISQSGEYFFAIAELGGSYIDIYKTTNGKKQYFVLRIDGFYSLQYQIELKACNDGSIYLVCVDSAYLKLYRIFNPSSGVANSDYRALNINGNMPKGFSDQTPIALELDASNHPHIIYPSISNEICYAFYVE